LSIAEQAETVSRTILPLEGVAGGSGAPDLGGANRDHDGVAAPILRALRRSGLRHQRRRERQRDAAELRPQFLDHPPLDLIRHDAKPTA
jgi:hypothetical protein